MSPFTCRSRTKFPELFRIAYENKLPLMLKGPRGCGKTRFLSYMAHKMGLPLITIACHEDLTASDLVEEVSP